jgi:hypothetical protein
MAGIVMTALPALVVLGVFAGAVVFAFLLDMVKVGLFAHLRIV